MTRQPGPGQAGRVVDEGRSRVAPVVADLVWPGRATIGKHGVRVWAGEQALRGRTVEATLSANLMNRVLQGDDPGLPQPSAQCAETRHSAREHYEHV